MLSWGPPLPWWPLWFGQALVVCPCPIFTGVHKHHALGSSVFSGSWHWTGPSLYPILLPTSPQTLLISPSWPFLPWILSQHLILEDSSCFCPLILDLKERFLEPSEHLWPLGVTAGSQNPQNGVLPPNWNHHYAFRKCLTWKYLIACSTKISSPEPRGLQIWVYEGRPGGRVCVSGRQCSLGCGSSWQRPVFLPNSRKDESFPSCIFWNGWTQWDLKWFMPLSFSGLFS